jgi:NADH:ubiquinone oxidoreductase subunit B-like Fe-S oxidoreductase
MSAYLDKIIVIATVIAVSAAFGVIDWYRTAVFVCAYALGCCSGEMTVRRRIEFEAHVAPGGTER